MPELATRQPFYDEKDAKPVVKPLEFADGVDLRMIELFFFAYRDFVTDADEMLAEYGFGRAHHRVLHFVNREPGLSVAELLEVLRITKQSLGPVLRELVDGGFLVQLPSPTDGRRRLLHPTEKGRNLSVDLTHRQSVRIHNALANIAPQERVLVERFLYGMIREEEHHLVDRLIGQLE
ncbi:MarR family winged helix-turn-helix transcriptional regulator [Pseudahrensia aquimaris]|uniref:MarR family winged helix-turn-helix transcriptional regulator n=1 Tax=Pseudahrensia aquimaris TaxID=744461 RepID=A0ABW3FFL1_9HYPH